MIAIGRKIDDHMLHQVNVTASNTTITKTSNDPQKKNTTDAPLGIFYIYIFNFFLLLNFLFLTLSLYQVIP